MTMKKYHDWKKSLAVLAVVCIAAISAPAAVPRPEHPRPDLQRDNWVTLNGEWQFEIDKAADGDARGLTYGKDLNAKISVPFCPESKLSGLGLGNTQKLKDVWYRRSFEVPPAMLDNPHLFGFCYTQLTDVEQEKNGLYYYDRKPKFDVKKIHDITARQAAYERGAPNTTK